MSRRHQRIDDRRVEERVAGVDVANGVDQGLEVPDAVIEQVGDAGGATTKQLEGVAVAVLGDDHHADGGMVDPELASGGDGRLGGDSGSTYPDDHDVRVVPLHRRQGLRVAVDPCDHLDTREGAEQTAETLASEEVVAGDHQAQSAGGLRHDRTPGSTVGLPHLPGVNSSAGGLFKLSLEGDDAGATRAALRTDHIAHDATEKIGSAPECWGLNPIECSPGRGYRAAWQGN